VCVGKAEKGKGGKGDRLLFLKGLRFSDSLLKAVKYGGIVGS
jgi:hypothetical protein